MNTDFWANVLNDIALNLWPVSALCFGVATFNTVVGQCMELEFQVLLCYCHPILRGHTVTEDNYLQHYLGLSFPSLPRFCSCSVETANLGVSVTLPESTQNTRGGEKI